MDDVEVRGTMAGAEADVVRSSLAWMAESTAKR